MLYVTDLEHDQPAMLAAGEWRATANSTDPATIGFHLGAVFPDRLAAWQRIARD